MVRKYVRKSNRGKGYTKESLKIALTAIKSGQITLYRANKVYKIPLATLHDHLKGRRGQKSSSYGRPQDISQHEEEKLATGLRAMEKWGFGLSRKEVLQIVADYVKENHLKTQFKDGKPGEDWFLNFKRRHNLSLKIPQSVEYARKKNLDPFLIYDYFDLLEKTINELGLQERPSQIWNLDESSFCTDPSKTKIVGQRGAPSTRTISGPGKQNTTVLMCCSASGEKAPPLIIFKGKHVWEQWTAPRGTEFPHTTYAATSKGWMETTVFKNYFQNSFLKNIGPDRPVLVIYDGHASHLGADVINIAIENGITILKLPPHTSHILQPLDLCVFKSLKTRWDAKLVQWQRKNVGLAVTKSVFSKMIGEIWLETRPEILVSGFTKAGIVPLNRGVIKEDSFDPVVFQRWQNNHKVASVQEPDLDLNMPSTSININEVQNIIEAGPSSSSQENISITSQEQERIPDVSFDELLLRSTKRENNPESKKRKRVCLGAEVVTRAEVDKILSKNTTTKSKPVNKSTKNKSVYKRKVTESSSDDDGDSWHSDSSEGRITEFENLSKSDLDEFDVNEANDEPKFTKIQIGDFVLVNFPGKRKVYKYVCLVKELINDDEVEVTGLKRLTNKCHFILKHDDVCTVPLSDIEKKLPVPKISVTADYKKYIFETAPEVFET
ncbi:uncharacterized protein LOC115878935 [Sitophilus oryzae]|uniref:Uncharacterized protein LOC115878935 n=1 Tax=Sitophilus oryzae TaxID=7048 RepID=A0A6J2XL61_SITOR|nr:uncharacterized protein LOC115878935 [Sitophilus oryzae]